MDNESTSINKYISDTGFCSRRIADELIDQGRVSINDDLALKGNRVYPGDKVYVDDEILKTNKKVVYLAFNKPKGVTCTTDRSDKANIIDFIGYKSRIFPIGRLDKLSEGLIFLTNDGDIVNKILRAGNGHEKEYLVTVDRAINIEFINKIKGGVRILGGVTKKCFAKQEGSEKFRIILTQGMNRQIRRMCEALGFKVKSLRRIRIMNITVASIPVGKFRVFTPLEIAAMHDVLKSSSKTENNDGGMDE
jgi:23S rRNA pseudouridine2604 synthase